MLNVSTAFKRKLYNDERDYINALHFTLADGTVLNVTHEHIMENGVNLDDAVGEDSKFNPLGATVCNSLEITLYNNDEIYSDYIFENAKCTYTLSMQLDENNVEPPIKKGVFTVDEATYDDYTITLKMLDNMKQFDRPYTSTLVYPATLSQIVNNACIDCNVNLATTSIRFPHDDYIVSTKPSADDATYREVLGWCTTIAGRFARCNVNGDLELKWFDTSVLEDDSNEFDGGVFDSANPYATGDNVEGGSFNPWNTGDTAVSDEFTTVIPYHYITNLVTQNLGVDDIIITGVSIAVKIDDPESTNDISVLSSGTSEYMIQITDNPFITPTTQSTVLNWLATQLIGLTFRQCNVTHPNDPTIEAGDVGILWDKNGVQHNVLITRVTFSPTAYQTVVCGAESISKNQATRITESTKTFIETRKQLRKQKSVYDEAIEDLQEDIANSNGLYKTEVVQQDQSVKIYYHNKPLLAESDIQMLFSTTGFTVTANGTDANPTWYGMTVDGQFLASVINTIGLFFNYAHGGTITLGGRDDGNGVLRILDEDGKQIGILNNEGIDFMGKFNAIYNRGGIYYICGLGLHKQVSFYPNSLSSTERTGLFLYSPRSYNTGNIFSKSVTPGRDITYLKENQDVGQSDGVFWSFRYADQQIYRDLPSGRFFNYVRHGKYHCHAIAQLSNENEIFTENETVDETCTILDRVYFVKSFSGIAGTQTELPSSYSQSSLTSLDTMQMFPDDIPNSGWRYILNDENFAVYTGGQRFRIYNGDITYAGKTVAYDSTSSKKYKNSIEDIIDESLDPHNLLFLPVRQFKYNDDVPLQYKDMKDQLLPGFIAEEVADIYPSAVIHKGEEIESWDERRIIPGMLSLIQEQHKQIKEQQKKIESLEARLEKLESLYLN